MRLMAGDEDAYRAVVAEWGPSLLRAARTYLSSRAAAEEAVQETWIAVLSGLEGFQGRSSLKTWVFGVLINIARSRAVNEARTVPLSALQGQQQDPAAPGSVLHHMDAAAPRRWISVAAPVPWRSAPEAALLAAEGQHALACALLAVPRRQRAVVTLRDVYGCTSSETCELLELTQVAQRVLLHRGRAALRAGLGSYYADDYYTEDGPSPRARNRRSRGAYGSRKKA